MERVYPPRRAGIKTVYPLWRAESRLWEGNLERRALSLRTLGSPVDGEAGAAVGDVDDIAIERFALRTRERDVFIAFRQNQHAALAEGLEIAGFGKVCVRHGIRENVEEVCGLLGYTGGLRVVISVPEGEALAKKTFNPRLGIEGGISILGTTGIVEPMSEQALVDTIHVELRQRRESGADYVLLAPGNYGADYIKDAMGIDPATAVMTSNFIGDALEMCRELGFHGALLIGHIGKLVKLAGGMWNTHSRYGDCRTDILTACAAAEGLDAAAAEALLHCATCDDALRILQEQGLYEAVLHRLAGRIDAMLPYKCGDMEAGAILFSKEYGYLCETKDAAALLRRIKED